MDAQKPFNLKTATDSELDRVLVQSYRKRDLLQAQMTQVAQQINALNQEAQQRDLKAAAQKVVQEQKKKK